FGDLFIDHSGRVYILDSGNSRIVICGQDFTFIREIAVSGFDLSTASGLFVGPQGNIWIALGTSGGMIELDADGKLIRSIDKPTGKNAPEALVFKPLKIVTGLDGTIYTVSEGTFQGIIEMAPDGTFLGYFGSNRVDVTLKVITEMFWKKFYSLFSDTATESMIKIVPIEYSAVAISDKGFLYAVTSDSLNSMYEIKKLDPKGNNIIRGKSSADVSAGVLLNIGNYGDIEQNYEQGTTVDTKFIDVCVDDDGFVFALDAQRGRVFSYDQESNLIAIFGGIGNQRGTFTDPVSVESAGDRILVLDRKSGEITVFRPTSFGRSIIEATQKFNEGLYTEAESGWRAVLMQSSNFELAYTGIGKAMFNKKNYTEAMKYFKLGYDKKGYDEAYTEFRKDLMRDNLPAVGIGLVIVAAVYYASKVARRRFARARAESGSTGEDSWFSPGYILFHPFKAFDDVRTENKGSMKHAAIIVALLAVTRVLKIGLTGFLFSSYRLEYINIRREVIIIAGLFLIWTASNWAVSTLMEGEGRVRDITIISAYALLPLILSDIASMVLSNVITLREGAFLTFMSTAALCWAGLLIFIGIMSIHRYTAMKSIASIALTVAGILFVLFLGALVYSLFRQMIVFFGNIFTEIMYRI
ncbi:MAG: YIP1 family protein, partial [Saccharofermentanales bacterium]